MNLVLVGFSTTGKSTVGRAVAGRLGWRFVDTDAEIERRSGRTISEIFGSDGEPRFREIEREVVAELATEDATVISTGGGVVLDPASRRDLRRRGVVILLEAQPDTIVQRLRRGAASGAVRPLLAGDDPAARVRALKEYRQPFYAEAAHWTIQTDLLTPQEVADDVLRAFALLKDRITSSPVAVDSGASGAERRAPYCEHADAAAVVRTASTSYPVYVGHGILADLGQRVRNAGIEGRCWVLADRNVLDHARLAIASLEQARLGAELIPVDSGEAQKTLASVVQLYDELLGRRVERRDAIVAVGGGVLGDMAGFVAATLLRGIALVHVPTTLLAMVDSSTGGKTGVNHPIGKNLIGAFYQPRLVVSDVRTLETLPERERAAGWAEVIKHALIADVGLLDVFEAEASAVRRLDPAITADLIGRSAAIKASVVSADEREAGLRMILNYGHTIGHAIEQSTGYGTYLHGEAVAIGMRGAAMISRELGLLTGAEEARQARIISEYGLPQAASVDAAPVLDALQFDKKVRAGSIRWIVLNGLGRAAVNDRVPSDLVEAAVRLVTRQA